MGSDPVSLMIKLFFYIMTISGFEIGRTLEKTLYEIYTSELKLKKKSKSNLNYAFNSGYENFGLKLLLGLYDKRYSFLFSIVWIPYMSYSVLLKGFHVLLGDPNLKIGRITTDSNNFNLSCKTLISRISEVY